MRDKEAAKPVVAATVEMSSEDVAVALRFTKEWGVQLPEVVRRCVQIVGRLPELAQAYERAKLPRPKLVGGRSREAATAAAKHDAACTIAEVVLYELAMARQASRTGTG